MVNHYYREILDEAVAFVGFDLVGWLDSDFQSLVRGGFYMNYAQ